jgi:hypothetical protein
LYFPGLHSDTEDGGSTFLQNVSTQLTDYAAPHPRKTVVTAVFPAYNILIGESEGKTTLCRSRRRWEYNIKGMREWQLFKWLRTGAGGRLL